MAQVRKRQKYDIGSSVDKEVVFDFPYLLDPETCGTILDHGRVMFLVRGPNSTGKATLSEMICDKYPGTAFCCADHYFKNSFGTPVRSRHTMKASHEYCQRKAESACKKDMPHILVQNTHMKKWEMQFYLDLAIKFNYTVIMAITLYRFNVSPEALYANSADGLDVAYFRRRLGHWEDVPPLLTGWFLCPGDAGHLQSAAMEALKKLTGDGKFCRVLDCYDSEEIVKLFHVRKISCCLAGYSPDSYLMKKYYLGDSVQDVYGKSFVITIFGFHVTPSSLNAVVAVDDQMEPLLFAPPKSPHADFLDGFNSLSVSENEQEFYKTSPHKSVPPSPEVNCTDWGEEEDFNTSACSFVHVAQKPGSPPDIGRSRDQFRSCLEEAGDRIAQSDFSELDNGLKVRRVGEEEWLVRADKKIALRTVFTGFYP